MLDSDVALLYQYETKRINETVARNKKRFPENFCFQLSNQEVDFFRSQIATSCKLSTMKNRANRYLPYVFTEQGIAMLSGLLKNDIAIQVSIDIMDAFVEMRKFLQENGQVFNRLTKIEYRLLEYDEKFEKIFKEFDLGENIKYRIFYDGQIYDAYSLIVDIIRKANSKIIIVDNYLDENILKVLLKKKENVEVLLVTSNKSSIDTMDIEKFNQECPFISVISTNKIHDRFIIIDEKELYHLGASIKDAGKKCFGINKIEDSYVINGFIKYIFDLTLKM